MYVVEQAAQVRVAVDAPVAIIHRTHISPLVGRVGARLKIEISRRRPAADSHGSHRLFAAEGTPLPAALRAFGQPAVAGRWLSMRTRVARCHLGGEAAGTLGAARGLVEARGGPHAAAAPH